MATKKMVNVKVLGAALAKLLRLPTVAAVLDDAMGCDRNARLSEAEGVSAKALYDVLAKLRPDCAGWRR